MLVGNVLPGVLVRGSVTAKMTTKIRMDQKGQFSVDLGISHRALPFSNGGVYKQRDHDNLHPILSLWRLLSLEV